MSPLGPAPTITTSYSAEGLGIEKCLPSRTWWQTALLSLASTTFGDDPPASPEMYSASGHVEAMAPPMMYLIASRRLVLSALIARLLHLQRRLQPADLASIKRAGETAHTLYSMSNPFARRHCDEAFRYMRLAVANQRNAMRSSQDE